jgi:hypothetical protein
MGGAKKKKNRKKGGRKKRENEGRNGALRREARGFKSHKELMSMMRKQTTKDKQTNKQPTT